MIGQNCPPEKACAIHAAISTNKQWYKDDFIKIQMRGLEIQKANMIGTKIVKEPQ